MKDGFVKVAAVTPDIRVADVAYNTENICKAIDETVANGAKVIVFPELCVTGYTCSDLFMQDILLRKSKEALFQIAEYTKEKDAIIFIGVPLAVDGELYNVAAALNRGNILGLTTKTFLPNYGEFYEMRQFRPGPDTARFRLDRSFCLRHRRWKNWLSPPRSVKMYGHRFRRVHWRQERARQ